MSPLPTGSVETGEESLSPTVAGSFSEALAAQTDGERPIPVAGFPAERPPGAAGDPAGELSESELELAETTGIIPETDPSLLIPKTDISLLLEDGVVDARATVLVEGATVEATGEVLPDSVIRAVKTVPGTPTVVEGVEGRDPNSQIPAASNRVPTPVESFAPTASVQPAALNVAAAQQSTGPVPQTLSTAAASPVSADLRPAPTPGLSESAPGIVTASVPDAGGDHVPLHTSPDGDHIEQSTGTFARIPTNASSVDLDAGPDVPVIRPARVPNATTAMPVAAEETVIHAVPPGSAQGLPDVEVAFPRDGVAEPATPARRIVGSTPPTQTEPQTSNLLLRSAQSTERVSPDGKSLTSPAPPATASAVEAGAVSPETVLNEKTGLGRLFGRGGPVEDKIQQSVAVVGARETTPIMVDLPAADGTSTHPVASLPGSIGTDTTVAQQVSVSMSLGPAEAWRYEEVARLLEDSGRVAQRSRTSVAVSAVMPLEAVSDWTGAAVRSSFAPPVLSAAEQLELPDQLVRAIRMQWRNGVGDAKLRLTPEHLGEVLVSLQVRQGSVSAVLRANSEIVRDWIRAHQHELKSSLESQGLRLDELVVEEDGHADQQPGREFDEPRRRRPRQTSEARFEVRV